MKKVSTLFHLEVIIEVNFKMSLLKTFVKKMEFTNIFLPPRTPQQNGVVERKNRSLEEGARTLLNETRLPSTFGIMLYILFVTP